MARTQTTASKSNTKARIHTEQPVHDHHAREAAASEDSFSFFDYARSMGINVPTWKRSLVAFVASLAAGAGVAIMLSPLIDALALATFMVTTSMFVSWVIYGLGFLLMMYASLKASQAVGSYIVTGNIDRDLAVAKEKVAGFFNRFRSEPKLA